MKARLDRLLLSRNLAPTRQKAQALIAAGLVLVNDRIADKAGVMFADDCRIRLKGDECPYVSRGGVKLAAGLECFEINPRDFICADVGASTGGFTDCLLQAGARRVYAIDVGYGQLAWKLRQDRRVVVMERTNARNLKSDSIPESLDLAVIDAAFISLKLLLPPLLNCFSRNISIIALIKPQFEVGKGKVGKGGVVRDPLLHEEVIENIKKFVLKIGLSARGVIPSPILGPKGNKEFLIHLVSSQMASSYGKRHKGP